MKSKKPDYTQFMRRPAPLEMSPPSDRDDSGPSRPGPAPKAPAPEEDIPWGEVIVEFGPEDTIALDMGPEAPQVPPAPALKAPAAKPETSPTPLQEALNKVRAPAEDSLEDYHAEAVPFEPATTAEPGHTPLSETSAYSEGPPLLIMAAGLLIPLILFYLTS